MVTPFDADFFKFGVTRDPRSRVMSHVNTVGAALVHVAPLEDPEAFEGTVKAMTKADGTMRGKSETAKLSSRGAVLERLREMRVPILEFPVVMGEVGVPEAIPGFQGGGVCGSNETPDMRMSSTDLMRVVSRTNEAGSFVRCSDLLKVAEESGFRPQSSVYLGRLMRATFNVQSINRGGDLGRGFEGFRFVRDEEDEDAPLSVYTNSQSQEE